MNLEHTGITTERVEKARLKASSPPRTLLAGVGAGARHLPRTSWLAPPQMESRLQMEVLEEVRRYGGQLLLSKETDDGQVVDVWEAVEPEAVQTPHEVFLALKNEGFDVDVVRVPVTDEKARRPPVGSAAAPAAQSRSAAGATERLCALAGAQGEGL